MHFKVTANFHPTLTAVGQLEGVQAWFQRVFQRLQKGPSDAYLIDGYNNDYCFTSFLQEVYFDVMDPSRFSSNNNPRPADNTPPYMSLLAFYLDDHAAFVAAANRHGLALRDVKGRKIVDGMTPEPIPHGAMTLSDPDQVGYVYEFFTVGDTPKHKRWGDDVDARFRPGWSIPPVASDDPLALEFCVSHTLLSAKPERLRRLFVDVLGGQVIHQAPNKAIGSDSVYVALGDGVYELAQPLGDGVAMTSWARHVGGMEDCYHGITFKTANLEKARAHLIAEQVGLVVDEPDLIVTDARDSVGVYWGFTTNAIPDDRRGPYPNLALTI